MGRVRTDINVTYDDISTQTADNVVPAEAKAFCASAIVYDDDEASSL